MFKFLFKLGSKFQFIKISLLILVAVVILVSIGISNRSGKVGGFSFAALLFFILFFIYYIRKWLQNNE